MCKHVIQDRSNQNLITLQSNFMNVSYEAGK